MSGFDPDPVGRAVAAALAGPGGVALVVNVFTGLTGVVRTRARRGLFRSEPERIQIGDWRYEVTADGRLRAAHLVNGIVLAEDVLIADAVGPHIARSLGQIVARYGTATLPSIHAAVEALNASTGSGD
jgi:hypothetical protein